jgi:hypothetical protein
VRPEGLGKFKNSPQCNEYFCSLTHIKYPRNLVHLDKMTVEQMIKYSLPFTKPGFSLLCPQESATDPLSEPLSSSPYSSTPLLHDPA